MLTAEIEYFVDSERYLGYLATPSDDGENRPGVLVCHEATGIGAHAKRAAERLADLGYSAFALDYWGDGREITVDDAGSRLPALKADTDHIRRLGRAGLEILLAQDNVDADRVAVIGYCFGGSMGLEMARGGMNLRAVVGFHSPLATARPMDAERIVGTVLVCIGDDDPLIPPEQRAEFESEMRAGGVDWRLYVYGGARHSFTRPDVGSLGLPSSVYHRQADHHSWHAMVEVLADGFGLLPEP